MTLLMHLSILVIILHIFINKINAIGSIENIIVEGRYFRQGY